MIVNVAARPPADLMHAWRKQIGYRHTLADQRGPRPYAVISYLSRGPMLNECSLPLRHLTLTALFDERLSTGQLVTRLVGVAGYVAAEGLRFGGPEFSRFDKNVRLGPAAGRRGARLDTADIEFFEYALSLERFLERCTRHPFMPRRRVPRLPVVDLERTSPDVLCVDATKLPKRQVIAVTSPERDLTGQAGTTSFDFVNTRFRVAR